MKIVAYLTSPVNAPPFRTQQFCAATWKSGLNKFLTKLRKTNGGLTTTSARITKYHIKRSRLYFNISIVTRLTKQRIIKTKNILHTLSFIYDAVKDMFSMYIVDIKSSLEGTYTRAQKRLVESHIVL